MDRNSEIRICSDGTGAGTRIRLADDTELVFIERIAWSISTADPVATTRIRARLVPAELEFQVPAEVEHALRVVNEYFRNPRELDTEQPA